VSTPVQGIIRRVHVTQGDRVKRGQPLVQVDSVEGGEAQAGYLEAKGLLQLAEQNHARHKALREEGISAKKEWLEANQELDAARIRADAARAALRRLGLSATANDSSGKLVLRAPSDGVVLDMHAVGGEVAKPDEPLVTLGDRSTLWVWADLYERDFARVVRQQTEQPLAAEVRVKAFPKEIFVGTVDFVSPSINRSSRTVRLRIVVPNPEGRLLVGMYAAVQLLVPGSEEAWSVPSRAVTQDEGRTFVFVHHHEDYYVRRSVVAGRTSGEWTEIKEGLAGKEKVVANGSFLLKSDVLRSKMGAGCAD
jgi:cobalt-zinc-cadmium efflux system membrane fusion protein